MADAACKHVPEVGQEGGHHRGHAFRHLRIGFAAREDIDYRFLPAHRAGNRVFASGDDEGGSRSRSTS